MTAAYTQSRNAVINGALRVLGVIGAYQAQKEAQQAQLVAQTTIATTA